MLREMVIIQYWIVCNNEDVLDWWGNEGDPS